MIKKVNSIPSFIRKTFLSNSANAFSHLFKYPKKQMFLLLSEILKENDLNKSYKKLFYFPFDKKDKENLLNKNILSEMENKVELKDALDKFLENSSSLEEASLNYYFKEWLPNDLLMKADKMGLANGLEIRVPFLDSNLINYFSSLSNEHKKNRAIFRKTVKNILPKEIMNRKKQGFTLPLSDWFLKKEFIYSINKHLQDLSKRNLFNDQEYNKIINNPNLFKNDHRIWVLLNLELWNKIYIDKINPLKISF